jgi:hypothetical protein
MQMRSFPIAIRLGSKYDHPVAMPKPSPSSLSAFAREKRWISLAFFALSAAVGIAIFQSWLVRLAVCSMSAGLGGAALLRDERRRGISLAVASTSAAVLGLIAIGNWLAPAANNGALTRTAVPARWIEPDPVMGYRLVPATTVLMTAAVDGQVLYRATYTIGADGNRVTPPAPDGADTYLFLGDSFVFGEGLADRDTLAAQFAQAAKLSVATANLAVPGYGPNHFLRALEVGRLAPFQAKRVKAVVTWIIPDHLNRVIGEVPWAVGPAYVLDNAHQLNFVGTFNDRRWRHPIDGAGYWLRQQVDFLKLVGEQQRQAQSADLFVALMMRIGEEVKRQFGGRFIVLYSWPDGQSAGQQADPLLVQTLNRLRRQHIELISINQLMIGLDPKDVQIPYDGHPTATVNRLAAQALKLRLWPDATEK